MKKVNVILTAALTLFGLMAGCGGNASNSSNTRAQASDKTETNAKAHGKTQAVATSPEITMTFKAKSEVEIQLNCLRPATLDWGDGSPVETVKVVTYNERYKHNYAQPAEYTLHISGEVTYFWILGLDVSRLNLNVSTLKTFCCNSSKVTALDVSQNPNLEELHCSSNRITALDVSKNTKLKELDCDFNKITALDVSKNTALEKLHCFGNPLKTLDVSKNTALQELKCYSNQLTSLDVSKNKALEHLTCGDNPLTSLDVSANTMLKYLSCFETPLTNLDLSTNTQLLGIDFNDNNLSAEALNALYRSLHSKKGGDFKEKYIYTLSNPGTKAGNETIAKQKGWAVNKPQGD